MKGHVDTGFCIYDAVFEPAETDRLLRAIEASGVARSKAGARHVLQVAAVRALATDRRMLDIAAGYLGEGVFPYRATLFDKSLSANWLVTWHQDTALPIAARAANPRWGPWTTKAGVLHAIAPASALERIVALRVHLDDSTAANGPLRVIPETHLLGVLDHSRIQALAASADPVECLTVAGGVVAIKPLTVHASSKVQEDRPRRVIHIEYATGVVLDHGIMLAVDRGK